MICKICSKEFHYQSGKFSVHLRKVHNISNKEYYDRFLREEDTGHCVVCKRETKFKSIQFGYAPTCSNTCSGSLSHVYNPDAGKKARDTILKSDPFHYHKLGKTTVKRHPNLMSENGYKTQRLYPEMKYNFNRYNKANPSSRSRAGSTAWNKVNEFFKRTGFRSESELLVNNKLEKEYISFKYNPTVSGFRPDFLVNDNIIIEINGNWHDWDKVRKDDINKKDIWLSEGYSLLVFTNDEVLSDIDSVFSKITACIRNTCEQQWM